MRIGIGNTIPEISNLPGQSGGGIPTPDEFIFEVNAAIGDTIDLYTRNNNNAADFIINWGEGSDETVNATTASHTYTSSGTKVIKINKEGTNTPVNDFKVLDTNQGKSMVTKVTSWGNNEWYRLTYAFTDCVNLETLSTDTALKTAPITVQLFSSTFKGCTSLQAADMTNWVVNSDTSSASHRWQMQNTFENCSSLALIKPPSSKVMPVSYFNSIFWNAGTAVADGMVCELQGLDFSSSTATDLGGVFRDAVIDGNNSDFSDWVFSSTITSLSNIFYGAQILGTDPILDCSGWTTYEGTSLAGTFRGLNDATAFNNLTLNVSNLNVQNVNNMYLFLGYNYSINRVASIIGLSTWGATAGNVNFNYGFAYSYYLKLTADDNFSDAFINSLNPTDFSTAFSSIGTSLTSNFGEPPNLASLDLSNASNVALAFYSSRFSSLPDFSNVTFPTATVSYYGIFLNIVTESVASHLDLSNKTIKPTTLVRAFENFKSANKITFPSGSNSDFSSLTDINRAFYNAGSASAELEVILPTDADYSAVTSWSNTFVNLNGPGTDTLTTCVADTLIRRLHATSLNANQQSLNLVNTKLTGSPSIVDSNVTDLETAGWTITSNTTDATIPFEYTGPFQTGNNITPTINTSGGTFSSSDVTVNSSTGTFNTSTAGNVTIKYTLANGCYNEQVLSVVLAFTPFKFRVTGPISIKAQPAVAGQSFTIDWGDGSTPVSTTGGTSIPSNFTTAGTYDVQINAQSDATYCDEFAIVSGQTNVSKVISWGQNSWNSLSNAFENCTNLTEIGETSLITDSTGNLNYAFKGCTSLTSVNMTPWNLSQGLQGRELFAGCTNIAQIDWTGVAKLKQSIAGMFKDVGTTVAAGCNFQTNNLDFSSSVVVTTGNTSAGGDGMFTNALIDADNSDISNWDFRTNIASINHIHTFRNARVVGDDKTLNISNWKTDSTNAINFSLMFDQFNEDPGNVRTDHNLSLNMTNWQFGSGTTKSLLSQAFRLANFRKIIGLNTWTSGVVQRVEYMFQSTNFWAIQEGDNFSDAFWANSAITSGMLSMFQYHGKDLAESDWGESPNIKGLSKSTTATTNQSVASMFQSARYTTTLSFEDFDMATGYGAANGTTIGYHIYDIKIKKNGVVSGGVDYSNARIKFVGGSYANWSTAEISFLTFGPDIDFTLMTNWTAAFSSSFPDWPLTFATNLNLTNLTTIGLSRTLTPCQADNFIRAVHDTNYLIGAPTPFSFSLGDSQVTNSPSVVNSKLLALEAAGYTITDGSTGTTMPFEYTTPLIANTPATPTGSFTGGLFSSSNGDIEVNATTGEIDTPNGGNTTIRYTLADGCYNEQAINVVGQLNNVYSMEFDGASDFILLDNSNDTLNVDYLTISIWFKPDVAENAALIGNSYFNAGYMSWTIQTFADGRIRYLQRSPSLGTGFNTTDTYNVGEWNHIAVTYGSNGAKMYLNGGTPVVNTSQTNPIAYNLDFVSDNVTIGCAPAGGSTSSPTGPTQHFNGLIDEVGIFNTALTEAEVLAIYNATETGKTADLNSLTTPPIAWYRMGD